MVDMGDNRNIPDFHKNKKPVGQCFYVTIKIQKVKNYFISTIFWREVWPIMIFMDEIGTPKRLANTLITAAFAFPLTGGSFTQISKLVLLNFFTLSSLEFGLTLIKIFILSNSQK